jgi:hypothetical protein
MLSKGKSLCIVILLIFAILSTTTGRARALRPTIPKVQEQPVATQQNTTDHRVQPLADGTTNPASISDEVALRVLFMAVADTSDTTRVRAKFGRMKLQERDMAVLLQKLQGMQGLVTAQRARIKTAKEARQRNPLTVTFADVAALDRELDTLAANTYGELMASLSAEGANKLREHLAYTKTRIKVFPAANMAASHH